MSAYSKKYLPLKEASVISGYTPAELKNFCKIGLVPYRKQKGRFCIRFDAFERINERKGNNRTLKSKMPKQSKKTASPPSQNSTASLIPFTEPSRALIKVLEPVAFAACAVMVLYLGLLPAVAGGITDIFGTTYEAVSYMSGAAEELISTSADTAEFSIHNSQQVVGFMGDAAGELMASSGGLAASAVRLGQNTIDVMADAGEALIIASAEQMAGTVLLARNTHVWMSSSAEELIATAFWQGAALAKISADTLAYMSSIAEELIVTSFALTSTAVSEIAGLNVLPEVSVEGAQVAGAVTQSSDIGQEPPEALKQATLKDVVDAAVNAIAQALRW